jgi:hypothetical protein
LPAGRLLRLAVDPAGIPVRHAVGAAMP